MKLARKHRIRRTLIEEWWVSGRLEVRINGETYPGTFHEAILATKQAPLIKMRDQCRRLAGEARDHIERVRREDGLDGHDLEQIEHDDY